MKVTEIRTHVIFANWRNWTFIELVTDEGVSGLGEATLANNTMGVLGAIEDLKHYVLGQDPYDTEKIWRGMERGPFWRGGAVFNTAVSAIDQALWDIIGKDLKVPVYRLLGGMFRETVRLYANGWFSGIGSPKDYAEAALGMVEKGFDALKFDPFGTSDMLLNGEEEEQAVNIVKAVRDAVGESVDLLIEAHGRFTPRAAIRVGRKIERFDPLWFEEPVPPEDLQGLLMVGRDVDIPIASGERLFTRWDYTYLLEARGSDYIQPDVCHAGGISELKKIAAMAETKNIMVAPHNSNGPISTAACVHVLTSIPNCLILEYWVDVPYRDDIILKPNPIPVQKGRIRAPTKPGLGVELDKDELKKHPPREPHMDFFKPYKYH